MTQARLALILSGILLFGVLTFAIGIVVGLSLDRAPSGDASPAAGPVAVPASGAGPSLGKDAAGGEGKDGPQQPAGAAAKGEAGDGAGAAPAAAAPKPLASEDPPPVVPTGPPPPMVTEVSSVLDPTQAAPSPLMGPLAAQAATPPLPPPPPQPAAAPPPPPSNRIIAVQLGRFTRLDSATVFSKRLTEKGIRPQIVNADYPGMPPWYLVTVGPQPDEATARRMAVELSRQLEIEVIVVSWAKPPAG